jgi:hypothetical protein
VERRLNQAVTSQWEGAVLLGLWFIALASFGGGASLLINLNRFSLLGTYRNRLIRAYLGASRSPAQRDPDAFTGFDEEDNLPMAELKQPADLGQTTTGTLPIHIINMTLNLAGEVDNLSWQDRKAESFIVSPFYCGSEELGYRETTEYGGTKGITAGTAVAISGAAVSPNMGASSSPAMAFLLTLFNVRLGSWLGNPGRAGDKTYPNSAPWNGAWHVVLEALGLTDERHPYIYLSDGGHFENLGLYEMVRRRCRFIVVCDAGADPDYGFEDLANAVRMIRIDFGIQITFYPSIDISRSTDRDVSKGKYCAIGHIRYTSDKTDDGFLLYIKPAFYQRNEPVDVRGYAGQSKKFPNETTADQFFTESQFESYRALGEHIVDEIQGFKPGDAPMTPTETFESFRRCVKDSLLSELRQKQSRPSGASSGGGGSKSGGSQGEKGDRGDHGERGPK